MRVWTLQPLTVYEQLKENKTLIARPELGSGDDLAEAYAWMRRQMAARVPRYQGGPVWWAYSLKPDLRRERHRMMPEPFVCLELELAEEEILISDFGVWDAVLNDWFYSQSADETEAWDQRWEQCKLRKDEPALAALRTEKEASWESLFPSASIVTSSKEDDWQVTFEHLRLVDVRGVRHFRGAYKPQFYGDKAIGPEDMAPIEGCGEAVSIRDWFQETYISAGQRYERDEILQLRGYSGQGERISVYCLNEKGEAISFRIANRALGWRREFRRAAK